MFRWKRVLTSLGIVVVACVTYLWLFGTQTFFALEAHYTARKLPFVRRIPVPLPDLSVSRVAGTTLSYFGYEFEVPWTDIDTEKTKIVGGNKAPDLLDSELSVFMRRLRVQGVAGAPGLA